MNTEDIKNWLEELTALIDESRDTDDRWQKKTRKLWGRAFRRRGAIKDWVLANKPSALSYFVELKDLMEDYFKYFKTGYQPSRSIDELPALIKDKATFILERIESL